MKTRRNANMVEIANQRMLAIYESIMSEGLLGALGGAALGGALGAGAGALGGDSFDKIDAVQTANTKVNNFNDASAKLTNAQADVSHATEVATDMKNYADSVQSVVDSNVPDKVAELQHSGEELQKIGDKKGGILGKLQSFAGKAQQAAGNQLEKLHTSGALDDHLKMAQTMSQNAQQQLDTSKLNLKTAENNFNQANNVSTTDKALNWASKNHVAAGAAAGAVAGGAIGAFAHDDRKDEADDEILEDDNRLF